MLIRASFIRFSSVNMLPLQSCFRTTAINQTAANKPIVPKTTNGLRRSNDLLLTLVPIANKTAQKNKRAITVSYTHLTLPTTPYV